MIVTQELNTIQVDIGVLLNESAVHFMQSFPATSHPRFVVNVKLKCLFLYFKVGIRGSEKPDLTQHDYRLKITFLQLSDIFENTDELKQTSLFIILDSAVICHRMVNNVPISITEPRSWREEDTWYRQTSVAHNPSFLNNVTTNLKKSGQVIDLGEYPIHDSYHHMN
jgi:RNA-dependent RNA polymerase